MGKILNFPKGFLWGSATAAYQVEGGIKNCDWTKFKDAGIACDHYNRYEEDFDLLKKLNQNAYRFSIEWSRIEPKEGKFDQKEIEHYRKVLLALKKREITSFVTLYHWTIPLWLEERGGWLNCKSLDYFKRFAKKIAEDLGGDIDFWITINEPLIYASHSYSTGEWPPHEKSKLKTLKVIKKLIKAHQEAYKVIHEIDKEAKVSVSKNNMFFDPYKRKMIDRFIAGIANYLWNEYFLNKIRGYLDFIGLNYYFHVGIESKGWKIRKWFNQHKKEKITDIGWEIYPEGIYQVLKRLKKYNLPIYITENGLADAQDGYRKDFIREHLCWVHKAIEDGIDVKGYLHWSIIDNFEWEKGFEPRFGLVEIDYKTLERKPRPSAFYYAKICKNNSLLY